MKPKHQIIIITLVAVLGFAAGTEYSKTSSLSRDASDIPGIQADIAAFEMALQSTDDALVQAHYRSTLNILRFELARAQK